MSDNTIALKCTNLSKIYHLQRQKTFKEFLPALFAGRPTKNILRALDQINFTLKKGDSLGVLGQNGSGKSTLLKLIAGVTKPSRGTIQVFGRVAPLIELGAGFHPELTGRENIYLNGSILGIKKREMDKLYNMIVDFAELWDFMDQPIKFYSSGMYMRLAFSVAVTETPDILLLDEILAVGDAQFQKKCFAKITEFQNQGSTIVMVSHNLAQISNYCAKGLVFKQGQQVYFGAIKEAIEAYGAII